MAYIGLDIGGTKLLGALFSDNGVILDKEKLPSLGGEGFDKFINQVYIVLDRIFERSNENIKGIGVGVPGTVDKEGRVLFTPNLPIQNFDLEKNLHTRYQVEVKIGNDVNLGTYGEYFELGMTHANVIGLFPGTGLGGGIVIDGKLYVGQGYAGELGHMMVEKDGVRCGCGNKGCLESYASKKGIISYLKKQHKKGKKSSLDDDVKKGIIKSSRLKKAYDQKDKVVVEAMNQFLEYLGIGIGTIMNIFNPDLIILGGGILESFGDELLVDIKKHAKKHAMHGIYNNTRVELSKLEDNAVVFGAFHLIKSD